MLNTIIFVATLFVCHTPEPIMDMIHYSQQAGTTEAGQRIFMIALNGGFCVITNGAEGEIVDIVWEGDMLGLKAQIVSIVLTEDPDRHTLYTFWRETPVDL